MKTLVKNHQVKRNTPETVAEQRPQKVIAPKAEITAPVADKPKKEILSAEGTPQKGLCATCDEAPHCAYAKNATSPILFCEMFDESRARQAVETNTPLSPSQSAGEKKPAGQLKGLCVNCDHLPTCTFPKPEGGVWHCEEYR